MKVSPPKRNQSHGGLRSRMRSAPPARRGFLKNRASELPASDALPAEVVSPAENLAASSFRFRVVASLGPERKSAAPNRPPRRPPRPPTSIGGRRPLPSSSLGRAQAQPFDSPLSFLRSRAAHGGGFRPQTWRYRAPGASCSARNRVRRGKGAGAPLTGGAKSLLLNLNC